jgi:radical SAM superfamily enzyme YgiQ (UPF0313 family)
MKIVLIYLPHPYLSQPDAQAPLGLMYIAAVLQNNAIDVEICSFSSYLTHEAISALPEADIYGITVTSLELPQANRFAHLIRERFFDSKIILGGPGTVSSEFVDWNVIDSICLGDGENAILKIVRDFPGLKKKYIGTRFSSLDDIPFPARHLLNGKLGGNIFAYNKNYKDGGSTVILTTRGCPFNCGFCTAPLLRDFNHGIKYRSAKNIHDEIKEVIETYNIKQFRFSDDMFTANSKRAMEIAEKIGSLDIVWRISCRVKPFDEELARVLYNAGCVEMSFGIESFDNHVLKLLRKGTTSEDNVRALEICDRVGIKTRVLFMIRTPGQTRNTIKENIKWLNRVPYNIIACTSFVPIPGCDIWYHPQRYDIEILNRNLDDYNFYFFSSHGENKLKDVIKLKGRSLEEVNHETIEFREYIKSTGKVNTG